MRTIGSIHDVSVATKALSVAPLVGGKRLPQLFYTCKRRFSEAPRVKVAKVNGQPALPRFSSTAA
ncbi:hypothetical protein V8Z80_17130 [Orrella sp. JC864]|uniref:hypothetical protein n=1 Tax=Orrella sp. JC864 TaxID=3120298 RepID=UPI003008E00B